jgi:hypothetical protein
MALCYGPYRAPVLAIGQRARCAIRGEVIVRGYTDAPVRWPRGSPADDKRAWGMIITGDLLRALTCEMGQAIAEAWGVSHQSVTAWRHALKIDGRGLEAIREHHRRTAVPPPPHVNTPAQQARAVARSLEVRRARGELWTKQEESLLGTDTDRAIAAKLGRPLLSVRTRRLILGIPAVPDRALIHEHLRQMRAEHFGVRYAVRWDRVLEQCRKSNTNLDQLARSLGTTRCTLARRFPCGQVLWPADWIQKATRYFGLVDLLAYPVFTKPFDYQRAGIRPKQ